MVRKQSEQQENLELEPERQPYHGGFTHPAAGAEHQAVHVEDRKEGGGRVWH